MPRDPKRIPKILKAIERVWTRNPDLRLIQLLLNTSKTILYHHAFNFEDDVLLELLKEKEE